ncbi:MAG: transglutaminase-like domain-containing protein [Verrucomicrobiota bacterium]
MRTPPLLMGGALLFWGWENGHLLWGALLAVAMEAARLTRARWELSDADLNRISDLCWALVVGAALLLYSTVENRGLLLFELAQWLPVCFCPIMLAQAYGNRATMPLSVFWWLLRRASADRATPKSYNVSYCYFALCLLGTSAAKQPNSFFYPGLALLVALALTSNRPRRVSLTTWVVLLALAASAGEFSHRELKSMQNAMETALGTWLADLFRTAPDAQECQTRIFSPGRIAQSGKIVLRLRPASGGFIPSLLREATWDAYRRGTWTATNNAFFRPGLGSNDTYALLPTNKFSSEVQIACYYQNGKGMMPLPHGTFDIALDNGPANVTTNRLGVTWMENGPGLLEMRALYGPGRSIDSPPSERDKMVPEVERRTLEHVAADLKLGGMATDRQKIRAIERFFENDFSYSLYVPRYRDPLGFFLTQSHAGHCEYFATATVLLLRQAGVPARYATGYLVRESARHGDTYLVRARDAHAWALAYVTNSTGKGMWEQFDTTPGARDRTLASRQSWWEPASDALSNLYFQFSKWRWNKTSYAHYTTWFLVPMILYLIGRIVFTRRRQPSAAATGKASQGPTWPGLDSELYLIDRQLEASQLSRLFNEPLLSWQQRLELAFPDSVRLRRIFHLHRSLRFDPRGLKKEERESLRNESQQWLADFAARAAEQKPGDKGKQQSAA